MIEKIVHLADIHNRKTPTRNDEYLQVYENLYISLRVAKPDRIVIVGDLVHDYLDLQGEQLIMVSNLLNELSKIAPVRITRGNHDFRKKNLKRVDSVKAIVDTLHNPNVVYYDKTGFYVDDNVIWAVWHHGEPKNNPWKTKDVKTLDIQNKITVDLFHDPISGCKSTTGFEMNSKSYYKLSDFKGDYLMAGDIHKQQYLNKQKTKAYVGSLISQDVTEGDDNFHGFLLWDVKNKNVSEVSIYNEYSFKNIIISQYIDFDDLDFEIDDATKYMKIRFLWKTLPQTRTIDNERKLVDYVKSKYDNIKVSHKNEFIESDKIDVGDNVTINNILDKSVQHEIFTQYLIKIGTDSQLINDVINLDEEILNEIDFDDDINSEWSIVKFGGRNFMSYEEIDIDWRDMDGLFQIVGDNAAGKTTIMKILSYLLFGKSLETETRMKYGDMRFVNNRNGADFCDAYLVIEANGEYYGINKRTDIEKNKSGQIIGAPTTLSYHILSSPDDKMSSDTKIEKLDEDKRIKTQKNIESIIGSYDNFMRIVMTTSDTLNRVLSNDMATFVDSLLNDSGLDIFDKKLEGLKSYQKKINEKSRISCNVEAVTNDNVKYCNEIKILNDDINVIETDILPKIVDKIIVNRNDIENLTKKLYKIDSDIYNLNVKTVEDEIKTNNKTIYELNCRKTLLIESIDVLKDCYDEVKLNELTIKKNEHISNEYASKLKIKEFEQKIRDYEHEIEIINGDIFRLKKDGLNIKNEIAKLKNSKNCPTCGQPMGDDHKLHIDSIVKTKEVEMFSIAKKIKDKESIDKKICQDKISVNEGLIVDIKNDIENKSLEMEVILVEIGGITNDKNDVEKRKEFKNELDLIPIKIQNIDLKNDILNNKIINYNNNLLQIDENVKTEKLITESKLKLESLISEENDEKENIFIKKTSIGDKQIRFENNSKLLVEFKLQEYRDGVIALYKKCVHRDGIPRQMLVNHIIPKINFTLDKILSSSSFKIWLDVDDLRPKLMYNDRPFAIIDCISASGKERTFSSIVLKFALNQINVKSKPSIFLLDEVMGKLDENSVEEFNEILQLIKVGMKKILIIEHNANINPDYIISVVSNDCGISSVTIE